MIVLTAMVFFLSLASCEKLVSPKSTTTSCTFTLKNKCTAQLISGATWERSKLDTTVFIVKNVLTEYWVSTRRINATKWQLPPLTLTQLVGSKYQEYQVSGIVELVGLDKINISLHYTYLDGSQDCLLEGTTYCIEIPDTTNDNGGDSGGGGGGE